MSRIACVIAVASTFAFACTLGEVADSNTLPGADDPAAGGPDGGVEEQAGQPDAAPVAQLCQEIPPNLPSGQHNAGADCMQCHAGQQQGAPLWTLAGTLYQTAAGQTASPAGTISITDANGTVLELLSSRNGNFYTEQALVFPLTATVTNCDGTRTMPDAIITEPAGCNAAGCHTAGARIY